MRTAGETEVSIADQPAGRVYRSKEERRRIVEESFEPGASVAVVARTHGINANQVFHWRKLYREGRLNEKLTPITLLPVQIEEVANPERDLESKRSSGTIHIEVGRARVRVEGPVDRDSLGIILEHFGR